MINIKLQILKVGQDELYKFLFGYELCSIKEKVN
jgi:hypothetical protein